MIAHCSVQRPFELGWIPSYEGIGSSYIILVESVLKDRQMEFQKCASVAFPGYFRLCLCIADGLTLSARQTKIEPCANSVDPGET